jgi:hypothetical protein
MDVLLSRLEHLPSRKWGLHETVLCQELGIKAQENLSVRKQLGNLLTALERGGWGSKKDKNWTKTNCDIMDLRAANISNSFVETRSRL